MNENNSGNDTRNFSGKNGTEGASSGRTEEFHVSGEDIMARIKQLVEEGNARRIIVRNAEGHTVMEFPLTAGVIGAALLPIYAALGAVLALAANYTIVVEKREA